MSFEVVVRPFVAPGIRPPPARSPVLPFQDTPEQGVAVLRGLGGSLIGTSFSESSSWSRSVVVEVQRKVTRQRVKQLYVRPDGTIEINPENYVDVEHVTEMETQDGNGTVQRAHYAKPPEARNIETLEENVTIRNPRAPT